MCYKEYTIYRSLLYLQLNIFLLNVCFSFYFKGETKQEQGIARIDTSSHQDC